MSAFLAKLLDLEGRVKTIRFVTVSWDMPRIVRFPDGRGGCYDVAVPFDGTPVELVLEDKILIIRRRPR